MAGAVLGGNVLTQLVVQRSAGKQKERERSETRKAAYQTELRNAYAQLVAAVDELIEIGSAYHGMYTHLMDLRDRALGLAPPATFIPLDPVASRESLDRELDDAIARVEVFAARWPIAAEQIRTKGVVVHLLESDPARQAALTALLTIMGPNPIKTDHKRIHTERAAMEGYLAATTRGQEQRVKCRNDLMKLLAGMDAP